MLIQIAIIVLTLGILSSSATAGDPDSPVDLFGVGGIFGQTGVNFRVDDADQKDRVDDGDIGFGFLNIGFLSRDYFNFMFGADLMAVGKIWADGSYDNAFDDDQIFQKNVFLKSVYLNYSIPNTQIEILAGRKAFKTSVSMDGDSYQGIQVTTRDIPRTTLYLAVINRWVEEASTDYALDGIQKTWLKGSDTGDGVSSEIYSMIAEIDLIEEVLSVSPYYNFQSGALANFGASVDLEIEIENDVTFGLDGIYAFYNEDTDDPTDADATSYLIYSTVGYKDFWAGIGYFEMSDDPRVELTAVGNSAFDPMEEGVYGGDPDDTTFYFELGYGTDAYEIEIVIGKTKVDSAGEGCTEIDVYLTYFITEAISLELMFVDVDDDDSALDYQVYAGGISMWF